MAVFLFFMYCLEEQKAAENTREEHINRVDGQTTQYIICIIILL